jgi:hypothetical protein
MRMQLREFGVANPTRRQRNAYEAAAVQTVVLFKQLGGAPYTHRIRAETAFSGTSNAAEAHVPNQLVSEPRH